MFFAGEGKPPMFGDYEAQRHWMEVPCRLFLFSLCSSHQPNNSDCSSFANERLVPSNSGQRSNVLGPGLSTPDRLYLIFVWQSVRNLFALLVFSIVFEMDTQLFWVCACVFSFVSFRGECFDPSFLALNSSRGYETPHSKLFMRATVIIADLVCFLPAAYLFVDTYYQNLSHVRKVPL